MKKTSAKLGMGLVGIFACFVVLIQGIGYVTFSLSPRDTAVIEKALEFEAAMGSLVRGPRDGVVPVEGLGEQKKLEEILADVHIPDRHPKVFGKIHSVAEWPVGKGWDFNESPMLAQLVKIDSIPPVSERLPEDPLVIVPPQQMGPYGGTWSRFATGPRDVGIVEARFAYEGLVRWDPLGKNVIPNLAVRWEIADEGRVFTFWLRKGVKWSDGHPFTVDDLVFWHEDVLQNEEITPVIPRDFKRAGHVMGLKKVDDYTVRFTFRESNGLFMKKLASGRGYEMLRYPAHFMKQYHPKYESLKKLRVMTKEASFELWKQLFEDMRDWRNPDVPRLWPWVVVEPPPARPAVFERNPYYWKVDPEGNQLPYIDRMTFEIFDVETINLKAVNGEIGMQGRHIQFQNYPLFMEGRQKGDYRVVHWLNGSAGSNILALNLNHRDPAMKEIIGDHRFRKALSHALNRDELNEADFFGIGKPRQVCPPPSSAFYDADYEGAYIEYDPKCANELLNEMGLKRGSDGLRLRPDGEPIKLYIETTSLNNRILELVASYWTAVGVASEVKEEARQLFYERKKGLLHDVGVWGGADEQIAVLDPRWFIPFSDESVHAVDYARWYRTERKRGETPPPDIQRCIELFWEIEKTIDEDEQVRLMKEIIALNRKNLWVIGTIGALPSFYLVKNSFRNVPEVAMSGWAFRTPGNTAVECYAIEE